MRRYVFPKNTLTQYFQKTIIEDKWFSAELHEVEKYRDA